MTKISEKEFDLLATFILNSAGIQLERGKEYLMEARLEPILERHGLTSYGALYRQAIADSGGKLKASIIDAITINETYFFRDNSPFELMKNKIVPDIVDLRSKQHKGSRIPLKIWSAASSTGQEVYSIAMMLREMNITHDNFDVSILGTDISSEAIAKASYGTYNQFEIDRGLSSHFLNRYFTKVAKGWRIKDEIRSMARFSRFDLNQPFTSLGTFDLVLCRNVAIYFPMSGKINLFRKISKLLNPGGTLLVGGSESLGGLSSDFVPRHYLNSVFYQLRSSEQNKVADPAPSPRTLKPRQSSFSARSAGRMAPPGGSRPPKPARSASTDIPVSQPSQPAVQPKHPPLSQTLSHSQEKTQSIVNGPPIPVSRLGESAEADSLLDRIQRRVVKSESTFLQKKSDKSMDRASLLQKLNERSQEED